MSCPFHPPRPEPIDDNTRLPLKEILTRAGRSWIHILQNRHYTGRLSSYGFMKLRFGIVKHPDLIKQTLIGDFEKFPKHSVLGKVLAPLVGDTLFTTNGETWKQQRKVMEQVFETTRLRDLFPLMLGAVDSMTSRLESLPTGTTINADIEMSHVTADIILRTVLSVPLEDQHALRVHDLFRAFQDKASRMTQLGVVKVPFWTRKKDYQEWQETGAELRQLIGTIVQERIDSFRQTGGDDRGDFLSALLNLQEPEDLKFEEILDQVCVLFLAGHETTASTLSWALYLLATHPEWHSAIENETAAQFGTKAPEFGDIAKLKKTRDVFRETLRLYPSAPFLAMREATEDVEVGDKQFPKGSGFIVSPWLAHRHREMWPRPDEFCPERWSDKDQKQPACAYIPFSRGPRSCIGASFAMQEAVLILAVLLRDFQLEPSSEEAPVPVAKLTLRSEHGIKLKLIRKS